MPDHTEKRMKPFMDQDFLLHNKTAVELYRRYAADQPIFDYHCHLIPSQIAENKQFADLTEIWLGGDHYKWRMMRAIGIPEDLITGNADPYDKFLAWAKTMPAIVGNPLYHWSHLELQRYFDITEVLNPSSAKSIWEQANTKLADKSMSVAGILKKFNVFAVGTTDDPTDNLAVHCSINEGSSPIGEIATKVYPSFRPDKALLPQAKGFSDYIKRLGSSAAMSISCVDDVCVALAKRLEFFKQCGCKASDHGIPMVPYTIADDAKIETIFHKALEGVSLTSEEIDAYQTKVLLSIATEYAKQGIVMQLHLNSIRNLNPTMFDRLGPDTGFDATHDLPLSNRLAQFLGALEQRKAVSKTVLYSLNPKDYYVMATQMGCFQGDEVFGKFQLGSGWWFCDHKDGIEEQLKILANQGALGTFIGMLTDSRSFLSYPRHEYFRRILCNLLGSWAENGEVPSDMELLGNTVRDISFRNALRYFV